MSRLRTLAIPLVLLALALPACDDATDLGDHAEAEGVAIMAGTEELYRYMLEDGTPVPTLTLGIGVTAVAIVALDQDGDPLAHAEAEGEEEEGFVVTIANDGVLTWTPEAETGEEHQFLETHGELEGLQAGSTTLGLCIEHEGHCDFEVSIPVEVEPTTAARARPPR